MILLSEAAAGSLFVFLSDWHSRRDLHPDIILMQIPSNSPDQIGKLVGICGASFVIPHHHDTYFGTRDIGAMMNGLREAAKLHSPGTCFMDPEPGKWYTFSKMMAPEG